MCKKSVSGFNKICFFIVAGSVIPALALFAVGFLPENSRLLSVIILMLPSSADCCFVGGNYMTHVDISPNFAGVIMGLSNFIPNFCSILAPLYVQLVVKDEVSKMVAVFHYSLQFSVLNLLKIDFLLQFQLI